MMPSGPTALWHGLRARVGPAELRWLEDAVEEVERDRSALVGLFPAVGRHVGRQVLEPRTQADLPSESGFADRDDQDDQPSDASDYGWTVDDAGRVLLLLAAGDEVWSELADLYRFGDAAERRAVLRSLAFLPSETGATSAPPAEDLGLKLVEDAIRSNDPRVIAAALSPYAMELLDEDAFNQAVLKCVFVGVPLTALDGLTAGAGPSLSRMLAGYVLERVAAGRAVPADVWPLIELHPPADVIGAIEAELDHPVEARRAAAKAALTQRAEHPWTSADQNSGTNQASRETLREEGGGNPPCASSSPTST